MLGDFWIVANTTTAMLRQFCDKAGKHHSIHYWTGAWWRKIWPRFYVSTHHTPGRGGRSTTGRAGATQATRL